MMRVFLRCGVGLVALSASGFVAGCGTGITAVPSPQTFAISGSVFGGSLPINGSHIYLYAANTQGMAGPGILANALNASTSLLVAGPTTMRDSAGRYYVTGGATGQFSVSGDYAACTTGQELYLYATGGNAQGGNPALSGGNNGVNSAIGLISDLGECSTISSATTVKINELSTVAAAYALAGYASDATHIGDDEGLTTNTTAAYAKTGMANAFANARNLVTLGGTALTTTPSGNGTVPTATLDTIANILAGCVQSSGPTVKPCADLFTYTGTAASSDTATAAINMAHNPSLVPTGSGGSSASAVLYNDMAQNTDFLPILKSAPYDYSLAILYAGGGITTPVGVAVDANGSLWVADSGSSSVVELSGTNASYSGSQYSGGGLSTPTYIAIDANGSAWATNPTSLTQLKGAGTTYTATQYGGGGSAPTDLAVDANNRVWVTYSAGSANVFIPIGMTYTQQTASNTGGNYNSVAVDASNAVWVTDSNKSILRLTMSGGFITTFNATINGISALNQVAINTLGIPWVDAGYRSTLATVLLSGLNVTITPTATDTNLPTNFIFDALGNPWAGCNAGGSICHLDTGGSGTLVYMQGTTGDGTSGTVVTGSNNQLAFDGSGNLWVSNANNVAEFVGAGTPVVTPLVEGVIQNKIAARP